VMTAAQLGERPFVIGHSFGGFMTMKVASQYGDTLGGAVIVDSPIRSPEEEARHPLTRPPMGNQRVYETFDAALARFRLMPEQLCDNPFIVEFIGRHSLRRAENGWVWKFDSDAMGSRRFGEPVREYLQAVGCRAALIFGEKSALVSRETASYMSSLMGPRAPVVEVPEARHHVMLDQPLAFVARCACCSTIGCATSQWRGRHMRRQAGRGIRPQSQVRSRLRAGAQGLEPSVPRKAPAPVVSGRVRAVSPYHA
jgi:pimeloyl-ACP methyl ester carboxylesterase